MTKTNGINNGIVSQNDESSFVAQNLIRNRNISMAAHAVVKLGIPDILAGAEGSKPMSAEEILRQLPTKSTPGPTSVRNLQRLLGPLVKEGLFSESLDGDKQPVYGLTGVSQWFIKGSQLSVAPMTVCADVIFKPMTITSEVCLHEVILDETTTGFAKANGAPLYAFLNEKPEAALLIQNLMDANSKMFFHRGLERLLQSGVLDGVNTLVNVGGGRGHDIAQIVVHNPHIQGINFDMPSVIATAPAISGVQHVGGSFFDSVPSGDAVLLKWIVHNYGDEDAIRILKNCFKALPAKNGKVILAEFLKDKHDKSARAAFVDNLDLAMLVLLKGGQERSKEEYQAILLAAGFPRCNIISIPGCVNIIEGFKE